MKVNNFEKAIQDFNEWKGAARIWYNKERNEAWTEVYANDVIASETFAANDETTCLINKSEIEHYKKVNDARKDVLLKMVELFNKGWEPHVIEYHLAGDLFSVGL